MPSVELRFSPLPAHVRTARLVAAAVSRRAGIDESLVDELKLAVAEACTRAVGLHQTHAPDKDVVLVLTDEPDRLEVSVRDHGPEAPDTAEAPELGDELLEGEAAGESLPAGFRLAVIAGLVDDLTVEREDGTTVVRMSWPILPADLTADLPAPG